MLTISKPLSAAQVRTYHAEEFSNARDNYYTQGDEIRGQWHGQLARAVGAVGRRAARRTSIGSPTASIRSPASRSSSIRRARAYTNEHGETREDDGAPRGMGRDVLGAEERVAHRARRRRCPRARGASRERRGGARRAGALRPGPHRRQSSGRDDREVGRGHASSTTARGRSTGTPRRNSTRMSCSSTSRSGATGETRALQPRELYKTQQYAHGHLPIGARRAPHRPGLRDRARRQRPAGDSGLHAGVPRGVQSPPPADSGPPREGASAAAQAPRRSRRTRPAKRRATARMRRCSAAIDALAEAFGHQPARVVQAARERARRGEHARSRR